MDRQIRALQKKHVYIGTSSWKYPGWQGLIYKKNYKSEKAFKADCLPEYAEHFSALGVDHTFYSWPYPKTLQTYFDQTPEDLRMGLKVTEKITIFKYPKLKRYGKDAGKVNEDFLNADLFAEAFLDRLKPFKQRIGPVMLEFSQFYPGMLGSGKEFTDLLDRFLKKLKKRREGFQLAVEIRNKNWLQKPYLQMLEQNQVAHVYNSWTRMPSLGEQLEATKEVTFPCIVSRVLLQPGTAYAQAVKTFEPYNKVKKKQPQIRKDTAKLIQRALNLKIPAYIFVNNRCEGCAPLTIQGILEELKKLKKL